MNRTLFICMITVAQLSALPTFNYYINTKDTLTWLLMAFGLFREMPKVKRLQIFALRILYVLHFVRFE